MSFVPLNVIWQHLAAKCNISILHHEPKVVGAPRLATAPAGRQPCPGRINVDPVLFFMASPLEELAKTGIDTLDKRSVQIAIEIVTHWRLCR